MIRGLHNTSGSRRISRGEHLAGEYAFVSHGVSIAVRTDDSAVLARIPDHLPPAWRPFSSPEVAHRYEVLRTHSAETGGSSYDIIHIRRSSRSRTTRIARAVERSEVLARLESAWHLNIAAGAADSLFVHAGVVGWQQQAILIPGRTCSGKTSLVAALVRSGAAYYSDEYAVLDIQGRVHPYAKPLSIRNPAELVASATPVKKLGGNTGMEPLPLGLIVITDYRPHARWSPRTLSAGEALLALLNHTVAARAQPVTTLATLHHAVSGARALAGRRGSAEETAVAILAECAVCAPV